MDIAGIAILGAIAVYAIIAYNGLVKARQMTREAWSGIDVQLKRRANLIPNLLASVKGYAKHESDTLEEVTKMRTMRRNEICRQETCGSLSRSLRSIATAA